jgi:hypothetical protein
VFYEGLLRTENPAFQDKNSYLSLTILIRCRTYFNISVRKPKGESIWQMYTFVAIEMNL